MINTKYNYTNLLQSLLDGHVSPQSFVVTYIQNFKKEWNDLDDKAYEILERMFMDANDYTDDNSLLKQYPDQYISELKLRKSAAETLKNLSKS